MTYGYPFLFPLTTDSESSMYFNLDLVFLGVLSMMLAGNLCRSHFFHHGWLTSPWIPNNILLSCFPAVLLSAVLL